MRAKHRLFALAATAMLVLTAVAPAAMAAGSSDLSVGVSQGDDGATVTVTDNGTAVENASVDVRVDENATYAGTGSYTTGEDGTVALPEPESNVTVTVTATAGNASASTTIELVAESEDDDDEESELELEVEENDDGSATVSVTYNDSAAENATVDVATAGENATYAGTGTYETGDDGTVSLPAPANNTTVTVDVTATLGNDSASEQVTLGDGESGDDAGNESAFGLEVSEFVHDVLSSQNTTNATVGQLVSEFVTENNPGADNRPEHAGPPWADDDGEDAEGDDDADRRGPPEHAGPGGQNESDDGGDERGPPEHAGPDGDDEAGADEEDDSDDEDDEASGGPGKAEGRN